MAWQTTFIHLNDSWRSCWMLHLRTSIHKRCQILIHYNIQSSGTCQKTGPPLPFLPLASSLTGPSPQKVILYVEPPSLQPDGYSWFMSRPVSSSGELQWSPDWWVMWSVEWSFVELGAYPTLYVGSPVTVACGMSEDVSELSWSSSQRWMEMMHWAQRVCQSDNG